MNDLDEFRRLLCAYGEAQFDCGRAPMVTAEDSIAYTAKLEAAREAKQVVMEWVERMSEYIAAALAALESNQIRNTEDLLGPAGVFNLEYARKRLRELKGNQ